MWPGRNVTRGGCKCLISYIPCRGKRIIIGFRLNHYYAEHRFRRVSGCLVRGRSRSVRCGAASDAAGRFDGLGVAGPNIRFIRGLQRDGGDSGGCSRRTVEWISPGKRRARARPIARGSPESRITAHSACCGEMQCTARFACFAVKLT